jgi:hypothetical protein
VSSFYAYLLLRLPLLTTLRCSAAAAALRWTEDCRCAAASDDTDGFTGLLDATGTVRRKIDDAAALRCRAEDFAWRSGQLQRHGDGATGSASGLGLAPPDQWGSLVETTGWKRAVLLGAPRAQPGDHCYCCSTGQSLLQAFARDNRTPHKCRTIITQAKQMR